MSQQPTLPAMQQELKPLIPSSAQTFCPGPKVGCGFRRIDLANAAILEFSVA
jgi:hypothetical protein